ncbi:MAG TPA: 3D domain-containing protein [Chthoniobacterales bacterium]|jgi:3D (Asp-Asp-Asp) domain-containing protein
MLKRFLITVGLVLPLAPAAFAGEQSLLARVTVYWASGGRGSDQWTRRHVCSTGVRLAAGHCAVDPRRIPYGSRVTLPDATLIAVDTGAAVVSRKAARRSGRTALEKNALVIDRFFETKQQALSWARRNPYFMSVRISSPDSRRPRIVRTSQLQTLASNVRQPPVAMTLQSSDGRRRSLEDRPRPSSIYAR